MIPYSVYKLGTFRTYWSMKLSRDNDVQRMFSLNNLYVNT